LRLALVLVGMMFLVPTITDKALGMTFNQVLDYGKYKVSCCTYHLDRGVINEGPKLIKGDQIYWETKGSNGIIPSGPEAGYVTAFIKFENKTAEAHFGWSNPGSGSNNCKKNIDPPLTGILKPSCIIEQGVTVKAYYCIDGTPIEIPKEKGFYGSCSISHNNTPPKSK